MPSIYIESTAGVSPVVKKKVVRGVGVVRYSFRGMFGVVQEGRDADDDSTETVGMEEGSEPVSKGRGGCLTVAQSREE